MSASAAGPGPPDDVLAVLSALPFPVWIWDAERRLAFSNDAASAFAGLEREALPPGTSLRDLVRLFAYRGVYGPGDPEAQVEQQLRFDRARHSRRLLRRDTGACHELHSGPLPGGRSFSLAVDVTGHQAAVAEASEQARRLEAVLGQLRSGLAVFDAERRLALSNPAYEELIGLPRGALHTGMRHADVMRATARRADFINTDPDQFVADRVALDRSRPHSWFRERPNGQVLSLTSQPVPDGGFLIEIADITDARRAEDEARRRAAVLDGILASLPHGVAVFGPDGRVAMVNAAYQSIMAGSEIAVGEHRDDIARRRALSGEYGPGDEEELVRRNLAQLGGRGGERRQRTRPNGTAIDVRYAPMPDGGHVQVITDVTALSRAQAEATARAALLQSAIDNTRHSIALYGPDRRLLAANRLAGPEYGLPPLGECIGLKLDEVVARQLAGGALGGGADAQELVEKTLTLDRSQPTRYQRTLPNGRVVEATSDPTPDGGFVVTHTDVTEQLRAQREASARAGVQQAMLDNIRHGIALLDAQDRLVAVNRVFRQILGLPDELLAPGTHYSMFVDALAARGDYGPGEEGRAAAARIKSQDRRKTIRTIRTKPDGTVLEVVSDPTPDGGWVLTYTDFTAERRIRAELERAKEAAEAANNAKSRFLAAMSHELRTPLNAVIGFAEAFAVDPDPVRGAEYVRSIREAGRQLLGLIDDVLDVARAETRGFEAVDAEMDVAVTAEEAVRATRAAADAAGVLLSVALPALLPRALGDGERLRQVLLNLLANGVKFTPAGGSVTLSAEVEEPSGDLVLKVSDTGIGIASEDIPRVFEPFTQIDNSLSRRYGGSGIGLYLSRALAEAQGATLALESAAGRGTTALLRFPAARLISPLPV
ncbi:MAG: PAS-domain containing protein [Acetobacteraceae bacterium]|nr:PAS-domain containing protein [Acetobacteraceae bacterium]